MKGVVLAGGLGTRLNPLTKVTNKHLLPVYDRPMIYYPIQTLVNAGIEEIMLVTGGSNAGDFLKLLGNGQEFGLKHLNYTYQQGEGGIADALRLAEPRDRRPVRDVPNECPPERRGCGQRRGRLRRQQRPSRWPPWAT